MSNLKDCMLKEFALQKKYENVMRNKELKLIDKVKSINNIIHKLYKANKTSKKFVVYYILDKKRLIEESAGKHFYIKNILDDKRVFTKDDFIPRIVDYIQAYNVYKKMFNGAADFCNMLYWNSEWKISKKEAADRVRAVRKIQNNDRNKFHIMILLNYDENFFTTVDTANLQRDLINLQLPAII